MTDYSHLDELVTETPAGLSLELLEAFRQTTRDPAVNPTDYASILRSLMEDNLQAEVNHAPG